MDLLNYIKIKASMEIIINLINQIYYFKVK
jgi:hypothetical protein